MIIESDKIKLLDTYNSVPHACSVKSNCSKIKKLPGFESYYTLKQSVWDQQYIQVSNQSLQKPKFKFVTGTSKDTLYIQRRDNLKKKLRLILDDNTLSYCNTLILTDISIILISSPYQSDTEITYLSLV